MADPVTNGKGRSTAIAISTLISYNDGENYNLLIKNRSQTATAVHNGLLHVVPSFMFQPIVGNIDFEFSVLHNIYREYLEEIFDIPEEDHSFTVDSIYKNANIKYLDTLLKNGEAELYFTGIAVNLLNLRPEICTLLLIKSPEWYKLHSMGMEYEKEKLNRFKFNNEFVSYIEFGQNIEDFIYEFKFIRNEHKLFDDYPIYPHKMVPPGAAAFWLGFDTLCETSL